MAEAKQSDVLAEITNNNVREDFKYFLEGKDISEAQLKNLKNEFEKNKFLQVKFELYLKKALKDQNKKLEKTAYSDQEKAFTSLS